MKKNLAKLLAVSVSMGMLTACGGNGGKTETTAAETKAAETTAAETKAEETKETETTAAEKEEEKFQASVLFCGSTSLYPIMSSLASSFTEEFVTWDKVDPSFPAENISIYVAPGGSGVGVSAAVDKTADFGMVARAMKDKEVEELGADYQSFIVARDALTVSVNAENPDLRSNGRSDHRSDPPDLRRRDHHLGSGGRFPSGGDDQRIYPRSVRRSL